MTVYLHPPGAVTFEGALLDDDRRRVEAALLEAVGQAVAAAATGEGRAAAARAEVNTPAEAFDPARVDSASGVYLVPSYQDRGKLTPAELLKQLPQPKAGFNVRDGASPLQDALVATLPGNRYITLGGDRYGVAGTLNEALIIGNTIFGTTSFAVMEGLWGTRELSYFAVPTNPSVTSDDLADVSGKWAQGAEQELPVQLRGDTTPLIGANLLAEVRGRDGAYLTRGLITSDHGTTWWSTVGLAALWVTQRQTEAQQDLPGEDADMLRVFTFDDIDALVDKFEAGDDSELQHTAEMLSRLGVEAFSLVDWQTKVRYLKVLLAAWTWQEEEVAVVAIFKTLRDDTEVDAVVAMLKKAGRYDQLFDDLDSELYDLLTIVGEKFPRDHGPLTFAGLLELFQSMGLIPMSPLEALTGISEGPDGTLVPPDMLDEAYQAVMGFVHFGEDLLESIKTIFTEPVKLIKGVGTLIQLVMKVELAQMGYPPAQAEVEKLLEAAGEKVLLGMRGAERLGCGRKVVRRLKWRLVWEIASFFVGAGEIKAAVQALGLSEKLAGVVRFLSVLTRLGEAVDAEAEAARLARLAELIHAERGAFAGAEEVSALLARLPDDDIRKLGVLLSKADLREGETLAQLAARSPELHAAVEDAVAKASVLQTLAAKAGGLTEEVVEAFQRLLGENGLELAAAEKVVAAVPAGEGARFAATVKRIPLGRIAADARPGFLELVASSTARMDGVARLGFDTFASVYAHAKGNAAALDRYLAEISDLERPFAATGNADEYRRLLDRLQEGDPATWAMVEYGSEVRAARQAIDRAALAGVKAEAESALTAGVGDAGEALGRLSPGARKAAGVAAEASQDVVRRIVTAETEGGLGRGLAELEQILHDAHMPAGEIAETLEALKQLNAEQRALRAQRDTLATLERIRDLDDPVAMNRVLNERLDELTRRARDLRRRGSSARADELERAAERLRRRAVGRTQLNDIDAFQAQVSGSKRLFEVMQAGGGDTLRRLWLQYWSRGRVPRTSFERYVEILSGHYRGNFGEFEVAFRLGERHVLLKAPDALVTLPGTDLIAIPRGGGDVLLIDNKAFSASEVGEVNALTRNLPRNLDMDLDAFAKLAGDPSLPAEFQTAVARLTKARNEIRAKFGTLTRAGLDDPLVQTEIGNILRSNGIRRVVTNAGGEVTGVSSELQKIGIELMDLNL